MSSGGAVVVRKVSDYGAKRRRVSKSRVPVLKRYQTVGLRSVIIRRASVGNYVTTPAGIICGGGAATSMFAIQLSGYNQANIATANGTSVQTFNGAEISALFDLAKVRKMTVTFMTTNQSGPNTSGVVDYTAVELATCLDFTDGTQAANRNAIMEYGNSKYVILDAGKTFKRSWQPKCPQLLSATNSTGSLSPWISTDTIAQPALLGLKGYTTGPTNYADLVIQIEIWVECKQTK